MKRQSICLNMIVKDESHVISRALQSIKPFIDCWAIADTGSTDTTKELICQQLVGIPGTLYERPWIDFAHNRNELLQLSKDKAAYYFFMDADEFFVPSKDFVMPQLDADYYSLPTMREETRSYRIRLVRTSLEAIWKGAVHEYISLPKTAEGLELVGAFIKTPGDGARSKDPTTYLQDAAILEKELETDPENTRAQFYLAQSYWNAHEYFRALKAFEKRSTMGGAAEEVFWSLFQIGQIQERLKMDPMIAIKSYYKAYFYRPTRGEPLYCIANLLFDAGNFLAAYLMLVATKSITMPVPSDQSFVVPWVYEYGLASQLLQAAYQCNRVEDVKQAAHIILASPNAPDQIKAIAEMRIARFR